MSDIGYKNASQAGLWISANSLEEYVADLTRTIRTPHAGFEKIGVLVDGMYRQLNANQLQIENEYYSTIRPKRSALSGERPTAALRRGGVEYVELRALDLDPFSPTGINETELRFAEAFLIYCLLADSPAITTDERKDINYNHGAVARRGREPGLMLQQTGRSRSRCGTGRARSSRRWLASRSCSTPERGRDYQKALGACAALLDDPEMTPSARVLRELARKRADARRLRSRPVAPLPGLFSGLAAGRQPALPDTGSRGAGFARPPVLDRGTRHAHVRRLSVRLLRVSRPRAGLLCRPAPPFSINMGSVGGCAGPWRGFSTDPLWQASCCSFWQPASFRCRSTSATAPTSAWYLTAGARNLSR